MALGVASNACNSPWGMSETRKRIELFFYGLQPQHRASEPGHHIAIATNATHLKDVLLHGKRASFCIIIEEVSMKRISKDTPKKDDRVLVAPSDIDEEISIPVVAVTKPGNKLVELPAKQVEVLGYR
jgi:hypothetical protein